jgi:hypothetical protein
MARGRYLVHRKTAFEAASGAKDVDVLPGWLPSTWSDGRSAAHAVQRAGWPIAGLYARTYERAVEIAQELFGPDVLVAHYEVPSGWKDHGGLFLVNEHGSKGVRYMCKVCGRNVLGNGGSRHNHWRACPFHEPVAPLVGTPPDVYGDRG